TETATRFVGPISFAALTHRAVLLDENWFTAEGGASHLRATEGAHAFVVAPATADLIGKFANGIADEIVSSTFLGTTCPAFVAPAMTRRMWRPPGVGQNVARLVADGVRLVGPSAGFLAERDVGPGRRAEPAEIVEAVRAVLEPK